MDKKKLFLFGLCVATAGLLGCSSGPMTAPNGMNLYLDTQFDGALLNGENQKIDFEKLINASDHGAFTISDQYAVELVSTTKFNVIRDAFMKLKIENAGEAKLDRQQKIWVRFDPYKKAGVSNKGQFNKFLKTLNVSEFVDAQVFIGGWSRGFFTEGRAGSNAYSPLRIQQATISGAWRVIGYAKDAAVNAQLGLTQDVDVDGRGDNSYFQIPGCDIYIDKAISNKKKNKSMGEGIWGSILKIQSLGGLDDHIDGERVPIWSERRCSATYQAIPSALLAYKLNRKMSGTQ